jgi:hypothetical protein
MAIATEVMRVKYQGDGSTTSFTFPFKINSADDIKVLLYDSTTNAITQITSYTLTPNSTTYPSLGGTISGVTAPTTTQEIMIERSMDILQNDTYPYGDTLNLDNLERSFDTMVMQQQQINDGTSRAIKYNENTDMTEVDPTLPSPSAGDALVWDENGKNLINSNIGNIPWFYNMAKAWAESPFSPDGMPDLDSPTLKTMSAKMWAILARNYAQVMNLPEVMKNVTTDDVSKILRINQNGAFYLTQEYVNVKDFGAVGDGTTDDTAAIQAALDYAQSLGVRCFIPSGGYLITDTLIIKTGAYICGSTSNQIFSGFPRPILVFHFDTSSLKPAINISNNGDVSWDTSLEGTTSSVQIENLTISTDSQCVCAFQLRTYRCKFENITIMNFCVGFWMSNSYLNSFIRCNCFNVQVGFIANAGTNGNTLLKNCWSQNSKGSSTNVNSRVNNLTNYTITKTCGYAAIWGGDLTINSCAAESVMYGVYVDYGRITAHRIGIEAIPSDGAAFYVKNMAISKPGIIHADDIVTYNGNTTGLLAYVSYASTCELHFNRQKPTDFASDLSVISGGIAICTFTGGDDYTIPLTIGSKYTNPSVLQNRSHFTYRGCIFDFILDYDSASENATPTIIGATNANIVIPDTYFYFNSSLYIIRSPYADANIYVNGPDNAYITLPQKAHVFVEVLFTKSDTTISYH